MASYLPTDYRLLMTMKKAELERFEILLNKAAVAFEALHHSGSMLLRLDKALAEQPHPDETVDLANPAG